MSFYFGLYALSQIKELVILFSNSIVLNNKSNVVPYFSNVISKLSISTEIIFSLADKQEKYHRYKCISLIIFELIKTYFKLKEWQILSKKGIEFHMSEEIYFSEVVSYSIEELKNKLSVMYNIYYIIYFILIIYQ